MLKTKNMHMYKYKEYKEHDCSEIRKIETVTCTAGLWKYQTGYGLMAPSAGIYI